MTAVTESQRTTPRELLEQAGKLDKAVLAVLVDGEVVDLMTPVAPDSDVTPLTVEDPRALAVLRHSAAHVMADAVQRLFPGTQVTIGPAIDQGFYYDFDRPDGPFTDKDLARIEKEMRRIIKANKPFYREEVDREEVKKLFAEMGEHYKCQIIDAIPEGEAVSLWIRQKVRFELQGR